LIVRIDKETYSQLDELRGHVERIRCLMLAPNRTVWSCGDDSIIRVWHVISGASLAVIPVGYSGNFYLLSAGDQIWMSGMNKIISIYDMKVNFN
jgi:WD40 repeat protein